MERSTFLVERYWPGISVDEHAAALARGRQVAAAMRLEGKGIEHVGSTLVLDQETVFCLFEAESPALVAELNERADFHYDRIDEAVTEKLKEASV
jgi:hypothetical protein